MENGVKKMIRAKVSINCLDLFKTRTKVSEVYFTGTVFLRAINLARRHPKMDIRFWSYLLLKKVAVNG